MNEQNVKIPKNFSSVCLVFILSQHLISILAAQSNNNKTSHVGKISKRYTNKYYQRIKGCKLRNVVISHFWKRFAVLSAKAWFSRDAVRDKRNNRQEVETRLI